MCGSGSDIICPIRVIWIKCRGDESVTDNLDALSVDQPQYCNLPRISVPIKTAECNVS
nr:Uncharacterised protein [Escherichia coli]